MKGGGRSIVKNIFYRGIQFILLVFLCFFIFGPVAQGATLDDLQRQQEEAARKTAELRNQANQKTSEVEQINTFVNQLNKDIVALQSKITVTQNRINYLENEIKKTEQQIKEKEAQLAENKARQAKAIQTLYVMGRSGTFESMLSSDSLSEMVTKDRYLSAIEQKIEEMMREIQRLKKELEEKKTSLQNQKTELMVLSDQLNIQKRGLQEQRATQQAFLTNASAEMKRLKARAAEQALLEKQTSEEIQRELARLRGGLIHGTGVRVKRGDIIGHQGGRPGDPGAGFSTGSHLHFEVIVNTSISPVAPSYTNCPYSCPSGPLSFVNNIRSPLDLNLRMTQGYGMTCFATGSCNDGVPAYSGDKHTGIDIVAYYGAPVYAASDGEIFKEIHSNYGYGHYIVIDHGNYSTLYAHLVEE